MRFESMRESGSAPGKRDPLQRETERIQNKLGQFLSAEEALETAARIYCLAVDVDEELGRILSDPLVLKLYDYDGLFFTPKGTEQFHRAFDGIHILQSLNDSKIETFFRGREKNFAATWLMEELDKHTWEAKIRRMNWEESGTLRVVTNEVIDQIIAEYRARHPADEEPSPLSAEEQAFFQSFENQLGNPRG